MLNELDINVSALKQTYPSGTPVLLFDVDGIPDKTMGVVDLIDDIGDIFIETEEGFKNVVLKPTDENVRFVRNCIDYDNISSDNFLALTEAEFDDDLPGVWGDIDVTDFFIAKVPELAYCLSLDNDDVANGRVSWNMKTDEVTLLLFNDTVQDRATVKKEIVLTYKDKDWVINAFNKESVEKYGIPAKIAPEYVKYEEVVFNFLNDYPISAVAVVNNPGMLNRVNVCCEIADIDLTKKIVTNLAENEEVHLVTGEISLSDFVLSDDGKYVSFDVQCWVDPSFAGLFRISDAKKGADMKLVSVETKFGNEVPAAIKKHLAEIETLVRNYIEFKGLDSKVASVDAVLADAKRKNVSSNTGKEVMYKEEFSYGE